MVYEEDRALKERFTHFEEPISTKKENLGKVVKIYGYFHSFHGVGHCFGILYPSFIGSGAASGGCDFSGGFCNRWNIK